MKKCTVFLTLLFLVSLTLVTAQPPFIQQGQFTEGYDIKVTPIETIQQNQDFIFNFHVYNITNGFPIDNSSVKCFLHIYISNGTQILDSEVPHNTLTTISNEWEILVKGGNFSRLGNMGYNIQCNSSTLGGRDTVSLIVTKTGNSLASSESLVYIILALGVFLLFAISFYFMIITPYANKKNEKGAIIQIVKLKYVKLWLIPTTWALFTWLLNILIGLADNFVSLTMYYGFFGFIFQMMNRLALPMVIVIFVISIFEIKRDANILENIKKFGSDRR